MQEFSETLAWISTVFSNELCPMGLGKSCGPITQLSVIKSYLWWEKQKRNKEGWRMCVERCRPQNHVWRLCREMPSTWNVLPQGQLLGLVFSEFTVWQQWLSQRARFCWPSRWELVVWMLFWFIFGVRLSSCSEGQGTEYKYWVVFGLL